MDDEQIMMQLAYMQMWPQVMQVLNIIDDDLDETCRLGWVLAKAPSTEDSVAIMNRVWDRIHETELEKILNKMIRKWDSVHLLAVLFQGDRIAEVEHFVRVKRFLKATLVDNMCPAILDIIPLHVFEGVVGDLFDLSVLTTVSRPDILSFCLSRFFYPLTGNRTVANFVDPQMVITFFEHAKVIDQRDIRTFIRVCAEVDTDISYRNMKLVCRMYMTDRGVSLTGGCSKRFSDFMKNFPLTFEEDDPELYTLILGKRKSDSRIPDDLMESIFTQVPKRQKPLADSSQ